MTISQPLQRLLAAALVLVASLARAQTTGTLVGVVTDAQTGRPVTGALVVATSPFLQGQQAVVTDRTGAFRITLLPPGDYRLAASLDGYLAAERTDIQLRLDVTLRANLVLVPEAVRMEEQVVKTSQARPVIDLGSAESSTLASRQFIEVIPLGRDFQDVAIVAPTARTDLYGVGFAGATSPENNYILDGMNVTDPAYGIGGSSLRTNFVQEVEIKTGNFMPEYGFSSGGIINAVTRSGSNEFHGSLFGSYTPGQLRPEPRSVGRDAEALSRQTILKDSYSGDFGFELGGPILKDRLWFYVGFSPGLVRNSVRRNVTAILEDPANPGAPLRDAHGLAVGVEQPDYATPIDVRETEYQFTSKLTLLFNENNTLAVSFTATPWSNQGSSGVNGDPRSLQRGWDGQTSDAVARFASKLLEKRLTVELLAGWHRQTSASRPETVDGVDQRNLPANTWEWTEPLSSFQGVPTACAPTASGFEPCAVTNYRTGGFGFMEESTLDRVTGKAALTWSARALGAHLVKGGFDLNRTRYDNVAQYSGGQFLEARVSRSSNPAYRSAVGAPDGASYPFVSAAGYLGGYPADYGVWYRSLQTGSVIGGEPGSPYGPGFIPEPVRANVTVSNTNAWYLQDSYSPTDGLTINAGLRWETQDMGVEGWPAVININDNFGPRIQAIYDLTRQGRSKVAASWGRFYEAIPLDLADRSFKGPAYAFSFNAYCYDPRADPTHANLQAGPTTCPVRPGYYDSSRNTDPASAATYNGGASSGPYQGGSGTPLDPGLKGQFVDMFSLSAEYELFPDLSIGVDYQGRRLGRIIEDMADAESNYYIANPGTGSPWTEGSRTYDPRGVAGTTDSKTGRTYYAAFPKPRRDYDAVTVSLRKNFSSRWQALASYTWSSLRGNYPGLIVPDTGQLDPNINATFDLPELLANNDGPLPGDSTHQLKLYGSYTFDVSPRFSVTASGGLRAASGTPINYLGGHDIYGPGAAYVLPRGSAGRTPFLTQLDVGARVQYLVTPPYAIRATVDAFNVLNTETTTLVDQNWTYDTVQPVIGGQCHGRDGAGGSNPIAGGLADCPSLAYLKTSSGLPVTVNQNFGRARAYQQPLAIRLGLELAF